MQRRLGMRACVTTSASAVSHEAVCACIASTGWRRRALRADHDGALHLRTGAWRSCGDSGDLSPAMKDLISEIWGWDEFGSKPTFGPLRGHHPGMPPGRRWQAIRRSRDRDGRLFIGMIAVHPQHQHLRHRRRPAQSVIASADRLSRPVSLEVFRINAFARAF